MCSLRISSEADAERCCLRLLSYRRVSPRHGSGKICKVVAYFLHLARVTEILVQVFKLPDELFVKLEKAATSHPPQRMVNPSKSYGLKFDIFDDYPYENWSSC